MLATGRGRWSACGGGFEGGIFGEVLEKGVRFAVEGSQKLGNGGCFAGRSGELAKP
ncbi:MAG: hypothetical protein WCL08_02315 [Verrucomicrobiota bacterium]